MGSLLSSAGLAALMLLGGPATVRAQANFCDPGLRISPDNPVHYQQRGSAREQNDRCEGLYIREVAGATLLVASFTTGGSDFDPAGRPTLEVRWPAVPEPVRLRAYSLRERLYYRMDTELPAGTTTFRWPTSVLAAVNVAPRDLGLIGWVQRAVGAREQVVYLPLAVGQPAGAQAASCCRLVLLPGVELEEVFVTLAPVDAAGRRGAYLRDGEPLKFGYYPAGRGITIPISGVPARGLYVLELAAALRGGGAAAVELWFYHPGS